MFRNHPKFKVTMARDLPFPTIFLLPTHFGPDELPEIESRIPTLTYDINEAKVVLGKITKKPRAILELRSRKLLTDEVKPTLPGRTMGSASGKGAKKTISNEPQRPAKRRKLSSSAQRIPASGDSTASDTEGSFGEEVKNDHTDDVTNLAGEKASQDNTRTAWEADDSIVQVVRLAWFTDSLAKGTVLPVEDYLVYKGRKTAPASTKPIVNAENILKRAREDGTGSQPVSQGWSKHGPASQHPRSSHAKRPHLAQESTSEHERAARLPPVPDYLHTEYSCQRPTSFNSPNNAFIEQLKKVRTLRTLEGDEYGTLEDIEEAASNSKMKVLMLFYEIWGVGAKTANEFYSRGWRDLDDIVEFGWDSITRVQQIGVKYYEELQEKIPRVEVKSIAGIILEHANKIRKGFQMVIVGGYRRGRRRAATWTHPDPSATEFFVNDIVTSLEKTKYVTHTLTLSAKNSERGQAPVAWKGDDRKAGSGFDTLDKALVVWQDPSWDETKASKNPNPHRRVDIINADGFIVVSPWRTAGCAVVGWTGGTTFERDLRRYCKKVKRLKFDSSGVRMREDGGEWVDLESDADGNPAPDMLTAEQRVFENLGLKWRPPEERCTG
ncbi:hypothetical protein RRF57_002998 [Xylaria bambusicola]|uniref:DNA polymerase n=1 Tax=Xylaria bambusicola TaxID=326684 RepID=A0AAN7UEF5_9PEZI